MKKTLNIGAGERVFETYPIPTYTCTNIDIRQLPGIDKVCDIEQLSFGDEEFDYILASDVIEHFPISKTETLLKEWIRVLKQGGMIEFRLPNVAAIFKQYEDGGHNARHTSWLLYGGQDYPTNFHYVGFDRKFFKEECHKVGLQEIHYMEEGSNMIVKYRKPVEGEKF